MLVHRSPVRFQVVLIQMLSPFAKYLPVRSNLQKYTAKSRISQDWLPVDYESTDRQNAAWPGFAIGAKCADQESWFKTHIKGLNHTVWSRIEILSLLTLCEPPTKATHMRLHQRGTMSYGRTDIRGNKVHQARDGSLA